MAHNVEPMDLDSIDNDFDNKENSFHHNNVLQCTEKGYEELDVSELNMKLRYSITPAASPMSKSYSHCIDNQNVDTDDSLNYVANEGNLTRSYNSSLCKNDNVNKIKSLPLQSLPKGQFLDGNKNASMVHRLDTIATKDNTTIIITGNHGENLSLPSSSSSTVQTPEATTPTKDVKDGGSPIMRGLKSVFNMFRTSTSPIPPAEGECDSLQTPGVTTTNATVPLENKINHNIAISTPIAHHKKETGSRRNSPLKDSIVFNDEIEKELQWKDETTIFLNHEKIPIHKLFLQQTRPSPEKPKLDISKELNSTVEYMDVLYNNPEIDKTMTEELNIKNDQGESDGEFVDCETTFTKTVSPAKEMIEQGDVANKDTVVSNNNNSTMEQLIKESSKVILNITVPLNDDNLSIDNILEKPKKLLAREETRIEMCSVPLNVTIPMNTNISNESYVNNSDITHIIHGGNNDNVPTEVSLDSIEINFSEMPRNIDNHVHDEPLDMIKLPLIQDIVPQIEDVVLATDRDSIPDSLVTNYELDSLEPNAKSNIMNMTNDIKFKDSKLVTSIKDLSGPHLFLPKSAGDSISAPVISNEQPEISPLTQVPADIPLPDDEGCDKSLSSTGNIQYANVTNNEVDFSNLPSVCIEKVVADTSNKLIFSEDINFNLNTDNCEIDSTLDIVTAMNFNQSDLSQILNDIDSILKSDCVDNLLDGKSLDSESLVKTGRQLMTENQNVTMDISETVMKSETFPDILNHNTTLNLDNIDIVTNDETLDQSQHIPSTVVTQPADIKYEEKSEILVDELSVGKNKNNSMDTTVYSTESIEHCKPKVTESATSNENAVNSEEFCCIKDGIQSIEETKTVSFVVDTQQTEEGRKSLENQEIGKIKESFHKYLIIDKNSEKVIKSCDTIITHQMVKDEQTNVVDMKQENESQLDVNSQMNSEVIYSKTVKQGETLQNVYNVNTHNSELTQQGIKNHNKTLDVNQTDVPLVEVQQDIQMIDNKHDKAEDSNFYEVQQELNVDIKQEIMTEEKTENTNCLNIETNSILEKAVNKLNTYGTEKDLVDYIPDKIQSNDGNIIVRNIEPVVDTNLLGNELYPPALGSNIEKELGKHSDSVDEEIIISENHSPYVSVAANLDIVSKAIPQNNLDSLDIATKDNINNSPLGSPPITSKGYNFNFDEISDPFVTKTKVRQSPTADLPIKVSELRKKSLEEIVVPQSETIKGKRISQTEIKKPLNKKKLNTSLNTIGSKETSQKKFDGPTTTDTKFDDSTLNVSDKNIESDAFESPDKLCSVKRTAEVNILGYEKNLEEINVEMNLDEQINCVQQSTESITCNKTSSSGHSAYYSAGISSNESTKSRNVFNLPEIDDINFNPFATKTNIRASPPPHVNINDSEEVGSKVSSSPDIPLSSTDTNCPLNLTEPKTPVDKMDTELMEKESIANSSTATCSSKATDDKDVTVCEVHTEDEDTDEGPFLEADDTDINLVNFDEGNVDMMKIHDLMPQKQDDAEARELFIDADAFEFLLNQKSTNVVADSGKESLFLKFDPLFAKRISSDGVFAALSRIQRKQSTPSKVNKTDDITLQPSLLTQTTNMVRDAGEKTVPEVSNDDQNVTVSKPMMVVTPAVNPVPLPRKSITPTRANRRSLTFTSPAMAVIDRLLSMSANNSLCEESVSQVSQEQLQADSALSQLRELLAEKEIHVYNLRHESEELRDRLSTLEMQMKSLESEGHERLRKINELNEKLAEKSKINRCMATVVEEYERTIASLIAETEQDKKKHAEERMKLTNERDEQSAHLASMEVSFSDLHSKYEKSKQVILTYKANEEAYKKSLKDFEENLTKMQNNYELLKQHATSKLNHANQEFEKMNRAHEAEVLKLNALIKRKDLHITSLEETLTQKTKANEELTAICDELINKVG